MERFEELFIDIFRKNGLDQYIRDDIIAKFKSLTDIMIETNAVMNITALTTLEKIIPLHYADCVKIAGHIPEGASVIDIGCGGGFPILPLAIVRPDLNITGLDSTDKKIRYVQKTGDALGLHITTLPIETIYINDNASSHFNPLLDTWRIYKSLFYLARSTFAALVTYCSSILMPRPFAALTVSPSATTV